MNKRVVFVLIAVLVVTLTACAGGSQVDLDESDRAIQFTAPGPNPELNKPPEDGPVAGLAMGFWHGLISPVTLIMSFLRPPGEIYEVHNNGSMYNLGFLLGIALVFLVLGFSGGRRRR